MGVTGSLLLGIGEQRPRDAGPFCFQQAASGPGFCVWHWRVSTQSGHPPERILCTLLGPIIQRLVSRTQAP